MRTGAITPLTNVGTGFFARIKQGETGTAIRLDALGFGFFNLRLCASQGSGGTGPGIAADGDEAIAVTGPQGQKFRTFGLECGHGGALIGDVPAVVPNGGLRHQRRSGCDLVDQDPSLADFECRLAIETGAGAGGEVFGEIIDSPLRVG